MNFIFDSDPSVGQGSLELSGPFRIHRLELIKARALPHEELLVSYVCQ